MILATDAKRIADHENTDATMKIGKAIKDIAEIGGYELLWPKKLSNIEDEKIRKAGYSVEPLNTENDGPATLISWK